MPPPIRQLPLRLRTYDCRMIPTAQLSLNESLVALDRAHLVHPVANWRGHERRGATVLQSGRGAWLRDAEGRELLDAFAGLWCVNIGYGHDSVVEAAARQMRTLPYATGYFGYSSEPAIQLAAKLVEIAPAGLDHVYLTLGGSEAVDAAVRLIVQYYNSTGRPNKKQFIAIERGYHGSSSTGAGLTALPAFHRGFDLPRPEQHYIASPYPYRNPAGSDAQAVIASSVTALRAKVNELGAPHWVCSAASIRKELGWAPSVQWEEGARRTAAWYRESGWMR